MHTLGDTLKKIPLTLPDFLLHFCTRYKYYYFPANLMFVSRRYTLCGEICITVWPKICISNKSSNFYQNLAVI